MQTVEQPKKRRGRPPKARTQPEGVDATPDLVTAPEKPRPPSPPLLAREVLDYLLDRYQWLPGDWRSILNTMAMVGRLGQYFSQQTRK